MTPTIDPAIFGELHDSAGADLLAEIPCRL